MIIRKDIQLERTGRPFNRSDDWILHGPCLAIEVSKSSDKILGFFDGFPESESKNIFVSGLSRRRETFIIRSRKPTRHDAPRIPSAQYANLLFPFGLPLRIRGDVPFRERESLRWRADCEDGEEADGKAALQETRSDGDISEIKVRKPFELCVRHLIWVKDGDVMR